MNLFLLLRLITILIVDEGDNQLMAIFKIARIELRVQTHSRFFSCHSHRGDGTLGFFSDLATFFPSTKTITKWSDRVSEFAGVVRSPTTSIANSNEHERYFHHEVFLPAKWAQINTSLSLAMLWRVVYLVEFGLPWVDKKSLTQLINVDY